MREIALKFESGTFTITEPTVRQVAALAKAFSFDELGEAANAEKVIEILGWPATMLDAITLSEYHKAILTVIYGERAIAECDKPNGSCDTATSVDAAELGRLP